MLPAEHSAVRVAEVQHVDEEEENEDSTTRCPQPARTGSANETSTAGRLLFEGGMRWVLTGWLILFVACEGTTWTAAVWPSGMKVARDMLVPIAQQPAARTAGPRTHLDPHLSSSHSFSG